MRVWQEGREWTMCVQTDLVEHARLNVPPVGREAALLVLEGAAKVTRRGGTQPQHGR